MRHLALITASLVSVSASAAAPPERGAASPAAAANPGKRCDRPNVVLARPKGEAQPIDKARTNRLGELPDGNLLLTVVRDVNGCQDPVIVRYGVGSRPRR